MISHQSVVSELTEGIGQAAMLSVMEDIAELTYSHHLTTFVSYHRHSSDPIQ